MPILKTGRSLLCILLIPAIFNQAAMAQFYREIGYKNVRAGSLTATELDWLKTYLKERTGQEIKDTIIIKYDFNRGDCWYLMDERESDEEIKGRINRSDDFMRTMRDNRPAASIFHIREPGNRANKIILFDTSITVDSTREVFGLLFKKRKTCGSSALIVPDGRFIITNGESHFFALYYTKEQVSEVFAKKKIRSD